MRIHHRANITFSATKDPHVRSHYLRTVAHGWPRIRILNAVERTRAASGGCCRATRHGPGYDRDEHPRAIGRGHGRHLERGTNPRGRKADVADVASAENRSHRSTVGSKLRRCCNGQRFRSVFY